MRPWDDCLRGWHEWLAAGGRSVETRKQRLYHIRRYAQDSGRTPQNTRVSDLVEHLSNPAWGPEARRSARAALRSFFSWVHASGIRTDDPSHMLPTIRVQRGRPRPTPERALLAALSAADERVRLMISLAAFQGLRRGEIAQVHTSDLTEDADGYSLKVKGKGGKTRYVPVDDPIAAMIRKQPEGWLFPGQVDGHLSPAYVGKLISRTLPSPWTAHTLRHRFASAAYAAERDLRAVQELLGHASVATTQIYTAIPNGALRRAVRGAAA